ncbi:ATP-binding cassette domain-containing protein [Priestia aryabhattai]|uniref:ABC transporter ATP-binding protein n=1 Tax=Priestia TaxID=2800373 RepID=UPI00064FFBD8|nr:MULTISPECIES: ABC transporter transmembrane domain-containing protein [Priestia]KML29631.1 multidrug ABC transporter ATP-binding protein [Priestia aryabhattai]KMO00745.1 multidrug ABC transporter ATP-binding protein [Priestia aryabhattai]KZE09712.1 multidrug ABC transporter ATP-binding protein [Priestia aryabhattai]MBY0004501.1 ATP-binding cassette domain-containing protein [Priestia aryabhattai]MBY0046214.1 ATP-binding cassette domain-containing protein [Priestia aryabhattai]
MKIEHSSVHKRLFHYTIPHKKSFFLAFTLLLIATAADLLGPILIKIFIDDYLTPKYLPFQPLVWLASSYLLLQLLKIVVQYFQLLQFQKIALQIIQQIRIDVFSHVHRLALRFFDNTPTGSLVSRITNDTEAMKEMFVEVIAVFIQNGVFLIGIFIAMFMLDVKLAFYCLVLLPFIWGLMKLYQHYSAIYYGQLREKLSQLNAKLHESLQGMSIIQLFRQEKRLRSEFEEINDEHYKAGMRNIKLDGLLLRPAVEILYILAVILVLSYFGISVADSPVKIGVLYAFINYLDRFFEPVNEMMQRLSMYQQAMVSASRVFDLMDEEEKNPVMTGEQKQGVQKGTVEFKNVTFSYDGVRDVLSDISFTVNEGETVALVGHTGSGKSSIINLLMRFYEQQKGDILIDNKPLSSFSNKQLRDQVGLVLQDAFLFADTVKRNITLHEDHFSDEQVKAAAKFVQAHAFIEALPNKYNEVLVERGSTLSSGQRQLLAFARTVIRNPKILILDEATAHIDTETEEAIQEVLRDMGKGRTTIAIAHRLSTIQHADCILVLHKGKIVEKGTHAELLDKGGLYYNMYQLQHSEKEENFNKETGVKEIYKELIE